MFISKNFKIDKMKNNNIKKKYNYFTVDFYPTDTINIIDIYKYLLKKHNIKQYLG